MVWELSRKNKKQFESMDYQKTAMQKEMIIQTLKNRGCRITKQRLMLLDIILEDNCSCCKEIYYRASKRDPKIGTATVYRMINTLEEIGAISRKNMYRIEYIPDDREGEACVVSLDDDTVRCLSAQNWNDVILAGMKACGFVQEQNIKSVIIQPIDGK